MPRFLYVKYSVGYLVSSLSAEAETRPNGILINTRFFMTYTRKKGQGFPHKGIYCKCFVGYHLPMLYNLVIYPLVVH